MKLYVKDIEPVAATYAYCLMRSHFQLCLRVYTPEEKAAIWRRLYPASTRTQSGPAEA